jgi:hypothetical protein
VSLSQDPAFSYLKNYFVCGFTDITNQSYAGVSGRHERQGQATNTTNGAGPHNLQLFMLASDGTVLHCLPGFWDSRDLSREMQFAYQLNKVYTDPTLRKSEKDQLFKQMQLKHIEQHPPQMVRRSHMQGFDQQYEAHYKLNTSDAILDPALAKQGMAANGHPPGEAFKTCDVLMHERMSKRPFVAFSRFDVANFTDYGKPHYDKNEDQIDAYSGREIRDRRDTPTIGDQTTASRITQEHQAEMEKQNSSAQWGESSASVSRSNDNQRSAGWGANQQSANTTTWGSQSRVSNTSWGNSTAMPAKPMKKPTAGTASNWKSQKSR